MKTLPVLATIVIALGWSQAVVAQGASPNRAVAGRIAEAPEANAALMQQYRWTSHTQVIDQGQVKATRIDAVNYGPDGQLRRSMLNGRSTPLLPVGFERRHIGEADRQNVEEYLTGLRDLLEQHTLPTAGKVRDFLNRAAASGRDAYGLFAMTGRNLVQPNDTVSLWVDPRTRLAQRIRVSTSFEGEPVTLTATFKTLASGLNHVAYAELTMPARQISVQVQNFDYNLKGPGPADPGDGTARRADGGQPTPQQGISRSWATSFP
jgi:hypothetical protein